MTKKKRKNFNLKRVGELMDELDSPHSDFDMGASFQKNGASAPSGPKPSQPLLNAFQRSYEPVDSQHLAQVIFTMGRLREYFQAWIVPKMPDPLPVYLEELDYMGFPVRTSFDGSSCIMVRYRGSIEVQAEEIEEEKHTPQEGLPAYTDDWENDLSDLPPFPIEENLEK